MIWSSPGSNKGSKWIEVIKGSKIQSLYRKISRIRNKLKKLLMLLRIWRLLKKGIKLVHGVNSQVEMIRTKRGNRLIRSYRRIRFSQIGRKRRMSIIRRLIGRNSRYKNSWIERKRMMIELLWNSNKQISSWQVGKQIDHYCQFQYSLCYDIIYYYC